MFARRFGCPAFLWILVSVALPGALSAETATGRITRCDEGVRGLSVTLVGSLRVGLFIPGSGCQVSTSNPNLGQSTTDASGAYRISFTAPRDPGGTCEFDFRGVFIEVRDGPGRLVLRSSLRRVTGASVAINGTIDCPPPPKVTCADGNVGPTSSADYRVEGSVNGCDAPYDVSLVAIMRQSFVSPARVETVESIVRTVRTDGEGRFSLEFDWCEDLSPKLPDPRNNTKWTSDVFASLLVTLPGEDVELATESLNLNSNTHSVSLDLVDDPEQCRDFVRVRRLFLTQATAGDRGELVTGRRTVARVTPGTFPRGDLVRPNVSAILRGFDREGRELPDSPLSPHIESISIDRRESIDERFADETKTWNFILPATWVNTSGTILVEAEIDPNNDLDECASTCRANNVLAREFVLHPGRELRIQPFRARVRRADGTEFAFTDQQILAAFDGIRKTYPYGELRILPIKDARYDANDHMGDVVGDMIDRACAIFSFFCSDTIHIAFVDPAELAPHPDFGRASGLARVGKPGSVSSLNIWTAAQEVGHNYGRRHAGNSHGEDSGGGFDSDYPYDHGRIGGHAFDPETMQAVEDSHTHDFMSYGGNPRWISDYTWNALRRTGLSGPVKARKRAGAKGIAQPVRRTLIRGRFDGRDGFQFEPFYTVVHEADPEPRDGQTGYVAVALDASDQSLATRRLETAEYSVHEDGHDHPFTIEGWLDLPEATARVIVLEEIESSRILTRDVSQSVPTVSILRPRAGDQHAASEDIEVEWTTNDADGDDLKYTVEVRSEAGGVWEVVVMDWKETSFSIPGGVVAGGTEVQVLVRASDGVLTGFAESAPFEVDDREPLVVILSSLDGAAFELGQEFELRGSAEDLEDGAIPDENVEWRSNLDGLLATGRVLRIDASRPLREGRHRIELSAIDSAGQRARASVDVTIGTPPPGGGRVPGDCNQDGSLNLADGVCVLGSLFTGQPEELPCGPDHRSPGNVALLDWQPDGRVDISDAVGLLLFLFGDGSAHPLSVVGSPQACVLIVDCETGPECN